MPCCDNTSYLDLGCVIQNDTWPGFRVSIGSSSSFFSGTLTTVRMRFTDANGTSQLLLTSSSGITIETATANAWSFRVDERALSITAGDYTFGIELTDSNGVVWTPIRGSIKIESDPV